MKKLTSVQAIRPMVSILLLLSFFFSIPSFAQVNVPDSRIAKKIAGLTQKGYFTKETSVFTLPARSITDHEISEIVKRYTVLDTHSLEEIQHSKPAYLSFSIPVDNGSRQLKISLYKENISSNGFKLITNTGIVEPAQLDIVHYRGSIDNDLYSVAAFTFAGNEVSGFINNSEGNYIIGKTGTIPGKHIIYNDKDLIVKVPFNCATNTIVPVSPITLSRQEETAAIATKCVNWYWETDYDMFVNKGSVANVNAYMQAIFNEMATLYANDGITMTLKTLFVWTTDDPYTGPTTSDYLNQFGAYRTSFDGDLAHLIGLKGSGGVAWINGICKTAKYKMAYSGISSTYKTVPTYSWSVECITHEQGHLLGSRHTHDCAWNGNNTKIDGCGDAAGYPSGTCTVPATLPSGGGTIMSYCHLTSAGINFNLGFGPQPAALMINTINAATCLVACTTCAVPSQPGTIAGNGTTCTGTTQTYSVIAIIGATSYTWSLPPGWTGTSTTDSIIVTAGTAGGTISVTANNNCGSSITQIFTVTVPTLPAQPGTISGNIAVCAGTTQTYTVTAVAGATSYTWTLPSGWTGTSVSNTISVTTGSAGGSLSVKANNSCGSSAVRTAAVTITSNIPAQPSAITGNTTACSGSTQTYTVTVIAGVTSYTWTLPAGWAGSSATNSITATAGSAGGTISVTANNGCGKSTAQVFTVGAAAAPPQPGTISGNTAVCAGTMQTYTVTAVPGAASYTWILPPGWTGSSVTNSITTTTGTAGGTISVTANNNCGNSTAQIFTVTVTTLPSQPGTISGNTVVCTGTTQTYIVAAVAGAISYTWTLPSGWTGTSVSNTISVTTGSAGGSLSVKANNSCGSSAVRTAAVTITSNIPAQPSAITGNTTACSGSTQTYTVTPVAGITSYTWTLPAGWAGSSATNSITATAGPAGGTISVTADNGCGKSPAQVFTVAVASAPPQPGTISGNTAVCAATMQTYAVNVVPGAASYTWILPPGWTGSSVTNSITTTTGTAGGTISVTANNNCANSTAKIFTVTVTTLPSQPGTISGNTAVCTATTQTYIAAAVSGATSYTWTLPSGWTGTSSGNTINATTGPAGGFVSVKANNSCGSSAIKIAAVSVTSVAPAQPGGITGNTTVCSGTTQTYTVTAVSGAASYTWILPAGWAGSSSTNSITTTAGSAAGNISVSANNGCGTSAENILAVSMGTSPATPGVITVSGGVAAVCTNEIRTYTTSLITGVIYNWVAPFGSTITGGQGTNSIQLTFSSSFSSGSTLTVQAANGCGASAASSIIISKNSISRPGSISVSGGSSLVCPGDTRSYSVSTVSGITYNWTAPPGATITTGQGTNSIQITYTSSFVSQGTLSVTANNTCGTSSARTLTVNRNTLPAPAWISGSTTVCPNAVNSYSIPAVSGAISYLWTVPSGATIQGASTGTSINISWGSTGGSVTVRAVNACGNSNARAKSVNTSCTAGTKDNLAGMLAIVYPNPAIDRVTVQFNSADRSAYVISIVDIVGKSMVTETMLAVKGINLHSFNISKFSKGTYVISVQNKVGKQLLKLNVE